MTIKPILFNTEMVRAILDGRKTCARRTLKHPFIVHPNGYITKPRGNENLCPYDPPYEPGDILYVRESFYEDDNCVLFRADNEKLTGYRSMSGEDVTVKWRPSSYMPKDIARIWIKVTDVRVERLQEITEEQACMEGTDPWDEVCYENNGWRPTFSDPDSGGDPNMVDGFHKLWNSTIKKSDLDRYGWDANPWVWVIEFERCKKPEEDKRCE
jgi:hypothetical protein